jgi:hypothetical protein
LAEREAEPAVTNDALVVVRTFLAEFLHKQLLYWETFQQGNAYISQSFILHRGREWFVRANLWAPSAGAVELRDTQERVTFYKVAHDHNFSFLSIGYLGSGYETELYEVEPGSFVSRIGEPVELRYVERTRLSAGKVMLYRASRDVHEQAPPEELSISLNLMLIPRETNLVDQYYFDLETRRVAAIVGIYPDRQILLSRVAAAIGNSTTAGLLERIAAGHPNPRARLSALQAFSSLAGREHAEALAARDSHPLMRGFCGV